MYPYLRWLGVLVSTWRRPQRRGPHDESVLTFHVWPGDLDFFGHMNNGRYLSLMDSGRWDIIAGLGLLPVMRQKRWIAILGGATIRFQRPLAPFERFELRSRVVAWDEKWFFIEQRFERDGKVYAVAQTRGLMRGPDRSHTPQEVLSAAGLPTASPPIPEPIRLWLESDARAWLGPAPLAPATERV